MLKMRVVLVKLLKSNKNTKYLNLKRCKSTKNLDHGAYIMESVRKYDYENYLCNLMIPKESRISAFAIRAFNIEVAQVRDLVTDKTVGLMRLQFWRDILEEVYMGKPRATPVALTLTYAVQKHDLSKKWLTNLIDAREDTLDEQPYSRLEDVEDYADKTNTSVNYLVLQSMGVKDLNADHAASHLGKAQGLVTLARSIPHNAQSNRVNLPMELLVKHGVSQQDVLRGCREQKMKDLVYDIASQAHIHLETSRSFKKEIPKSAVPLLISSICCESYLKSIQKVDFDVFDPRLQQRNSMLPLLLWLQKKKKTY